MDGNRFDHFTRSFAERRSRRAILKSAAGGAAGGLLALVGAGRGAAKAEKVTLCHKPGTPAQQALGVDASAVPAHLGHGDYLNAAGCCAGGSAVCIDGAGSGTCCSAPSRCLDGGICCTPTTCAAEGKNCGTISDNCGGTLDCGICTAPQTCGGGPDAAPNLCGCTPTTCSAQSATCGTIADGCGGTLPCGECDPSQCLTCDDTSHACVSICIGALACFGGDCKLIDGAPGCAADGDCGSGVCVAGTCQVARGGEGAACDGDADCLDGRPCVNIVEGRGVCCASGTACGTTCCPGDTQVCDRDGACCAPTTCAAQGKNCGTIPDDCGLDLDCGACGDGDECVENVCRPVVCLPAGTACDILPGGVDACCDDSVCDFPELVCCNPTGTACSVVPGSGDTCCEHNLCLEQGPLGLERCVACEPDFNNIFGTDACNADTLCCSGFCHTPSGNCCRRAGAPCTELGPLGFECCPYLGLTCSADGNGTCIQCRTAGESCVENGAASTCCIGLNCVDGACVQEECSILCQVDSTCCQGTVCNADAGVCVAP